MKKILTCFIMIIILSVTGCSSNQVNWLTVVCDLENFIRISEDDEYFGYLDLRKLKLYNKNEEIIAYVADTCKVSVENGSSYGICAEENYMYDFLVIKDSFGKTYEIYNNNSEYLAQIQTATDDKIKLLDQDKNIIAEAEKNDKNQIIIKIYNRLINEKALIIIVNIYYELENTKL